MGGQSQLVLRKATIDDLEDITTVAQEAFPDDPEWNYRFPYRDKYPEDNRKYTMIEYEEYIGQPEKYGVFVVTTPRVGYDKTRRAAKTPDRPIAIGVWDIAVMTPQKGRGKQSSPQPQCVCSAAIVDLQPLRPLRSFL